MLFCTTNEHHEPSYFYQILSPSSLVSNRSALNKQLITLIAIGAVVVFYAMAIIEYIGPSTFGSNYSDSFTLLSSANKIALFAMLMNGTLIHSHRFTMVKVAFGIILLGGIMKILHLPWAGEIRGLAKIGLAIIYTLHYTSKPSKSILDTMKLDAVLLLVAPLGLAFYDPSIAQDIAVVAELACAAAFFCFLYVEQDRYLKSPHA